MKKEDRPGIEKALDELVEDITVDANGEDEQLWAFRQAFEDDIPVPCEATVIGEPVQVKKFDYDGNERRGLTATCRRADGTKHAVAASEVVMPLSTQGGRYLAAYRKWMGIAPFPPGTRGKARRQTAAALHPDGTVELVVLSVRQKVARCRLLNDDRTLTFRASRLRDVAPGEIAVVRPAKQWTYAGNPYLSGAIESTRLDAKALALVPLRLDERGIWNPAEHYWGEEGEPIEEWARPIIARGPRPEFEMEQVLPGLDSDDPFSDPIGESNDRKDSGDRAGAYKILMDLCQADLRCLDAHAHLGNLVFDGRPEDAIRHYEAGFRIGELSFGEGFDGVLPWGWIDNRPLLRCMHGFGLCLWRLGRFEEAGRIFDRMLWLNPSDNQGVRLLVDQVRAKDSWQDCR
jgi:tetratricopeptide (TPR) repeat protein